VASEPTGAEVTLNGKLLGSTPLRLAVGAEAGPLRLNLAGYYPQEFEVALKRGGEVRISASEARLVAKLGSVTVMVDPPEAGIQVYLDGVAKGEAPLTLEKVAVGNHEIKAEGQELGGVATVEVSDLNVAMVTVSVKKRGGSGMVAVKGGCFEMGSNDGDSDEKPVHRVCVSDFQIGKYEVTQAEWEAVMGGNPSKHNGCARCPVEQVSWNDIQEFLEKLNAKSGLQYRLPTEAEWEYAARGGAQSRGYTYSGSNDLAAVGWYDNNSGSQTHPVGEKQANELGLYDMNGNVWEWVNDWRDSSYYANSPSNDPQGPSSGSYRVNRGGSWDSGAASARVAFRGSSDPSYRAAYLGFRLARTH
jgi:formylglycine-generating enzyme required for sulfatase activity